MHELIRDITLCILFAWMLGLLAHFSRQPLILAYLIAGFCIGPFGAGWVKSQESISVISELGLIFMLFMIGLEIDLKKVLSRGYSFQEEILYWCKHVGCRIGETPILFENRRSGVSKINLPHRLAPSDEYDGCKSWIDVPVSWEHDIAAHVVRTEEFATRRSRILGAISTVAVSSSTTHLPKVTLNPRPA